MNWSRRTLLQRTAALSTAGTAALAGCSNAASDRDQQSPGDGDSGDSSGPTTVDGRLALPSVEAPGSPGDVVPISRPGKVSIVEFFATWCGPCKPQMAELNAVREQFDESELSLVSVTEELRPEKIRTFWTEHDGNWPALMDEELRANAKYDVSGLPTTLVLAPDGSVHNRHRGGPYRASAIASEVESAME
jgi:thiol-disulfide isomerase/thioredoxin